MAEAERVVQRQAGELGASILRSVQERPWPTLLLATMAGYVLGGGLVSPLTRPIARAAMGALLVPDFRQRILGEAGNLGQAMGAV
jgi:hypothetical protein